MKCRTSEMEFLSDSIENKVACYICQVRTKTKESIEAVIMKQRQQCVAFAVVILAS